MLHEVVNVVGPLICGAIIVFQGFKYRQLKLKLTQPSKPMYGTLDYYYQDELERNPGVTQVILVINSNKKITLPVKYESSALNMARKIYGLSFVQEFRELLPMPKQLELDKQNLLEERKKLLLMEESLAKKEQAIIEMEVQQELDS